MSMFDDVLGMGRTSVIEGAYEPEVEEITLESAGEIPSYMDPIEFMTQVACEQEMNMQRLDMAILAEEYMYLRENGAEMVYEAASIQGVIDKCKKGIDWLWSQITKFFKTVQKKLDEALKLDTRFLSGYKSKALKCTRMVPIRTWLDVLDTDVIAKTAPESYKLFTIAAALAYDNIGHAKEDEDLVAEYHKSLGGEDVTVKEICTKMLKVAKHGPDENSDAKTPTKEYKASELVKWFEGSKKSKQTVKKSYDDNKKIINQMYKGAKKMESIAKTARVISNEESRSIHQSVKLINRIGKDLTVVNKTVVKIINLQRSTLKKGIVKAAALGSGTITDADKARMKAESASMIESVQFGEIL